MVAAHRIQQAGAPVTVLEASPHAGGKVRTLREQGYLIEWGPQSYLHEEGGAYARAIALAGLDDQVVEPPRKARFVLRRGRLWNMPRQVYRLLSLGGLAGAASEVLTPRGGDANESVHAFAQRRFGPEVAEVLIGALVSGVFAGDPRRLELRSAFPRMAQIEQRHGSLVRALVGGGFKPRKLCGLRGGMGVLTETLAKQLAGGLRLETPVTRVWRRGLAPGAAWCVETSAGALEAAGVVVTAPAAEAAQLLRGQDPFLATHLDGIDYAALAAVALGYDASAFPGGVPEGFGFLVPRTEGLRTLGCLFPSAVFDDAAPPGKVLLRIMIGGRLDPGAVELSEDELVALARQEVEPILGARAAPELTRVVRQARAIPQYELGHAARVHAIEAGVARHPGLFLTGNPYRGVSVGDVAADAERTAAAVVRRLSER